MKIICVCGFGVGSSLILKMKVAEVLKEEGFDVKVEAQDVTSASGTDAKLIFASKEIANQIKKVKCPIIEIHNFLNKEEIREKGVPVVRKLLAEL